MPDKTVAERILEELVTLNNRVRAIADLLVVANAKREGVVPERQLKDWTGEGQRQVKAGEFEPE